MSLLIFNNCKLLMTLTITSNILVSLYEEILNTYYCKET